jgi:hypothetical protein
MAAGITAQIIDGLLTYLGTLSIGSPPLPIAMPGRQFRPPASGKYLEATFMPNQPGPPLIPFGSADRHQGLLQIAVYWPVDEGHVTPLDIAGNVVKAFRRGTVIASGALRIHIYETPWASQPIQEASTVEVPVTIPWTCVATTPA